MKNRVFPAMLVSGAIMMALAACSSGPFNYVSAGDPALAACATTVIVTDIGSADSSIDAANHTDPQGMGYASSALSSSDERQFAAWAVDLQGLAGSLHGQHRWFADDLNEEAQLLDTASQAGSTGYTTNSLAIATDKYTSAISADCSSFRVGTATRQPSAKPGPHGRPGPGLLSFLGNRDFWVAILCYLLVVPWMSIALAITERRKPRDQRRDGGQLFRSAAAWPVTLAIAIWQTWKFWLNRASLTPDERRDDRIAAIQAKNRQLEEGLNDTTGNQ